jgi:uncharacterized DUF497 family protein
LRGGKSGRERRRETRQRSHLAEHGISRVHCEAILSTKQSIIGDDAIDDGIEHRYMWIRKMGAHNNYEETRHRVGCSWSEVENTILESR